MIKNKIIFSLLISVFFLLVIEMSLRLFYPLIRDYHMEMWRYCRELKRKSGFPNLPFEHIPNKRVELYNNVQIKTNALGMRADHNYVIPKPKHTKRVLVIGDSTTMGWGVNLKDTYPYLLESLLNKDSSGIHYEVMNAGVGNYNSAAELETLKKFINTDPDIVILGFFINDPENITFPSLIFFRKYSYLYAFIWSKLINMKSSFTEFDYKTYYSSLYKNEELLSRTRDDIVGMLRITQERSISFVLVNIPEMHNFKNYYFEKAQQFISNIAYDYHDIIFIDLLESMKDRDARKFWVSDNEDPHPNTLFYRIAANVIYNKLKILGIVF